jgi:hypothetical protein
MNREAPEMVRLARRYCALIETSGTKNASWLKEVALLLPRLRAVVKSLNDRSYKDIAVLFPDLDARFELYTHLVNLLGDRDSYWHEFDREDDTHAMTGSLADDLTDIYCELKHGLRTLKEDPEQSLLAWQEGFARHWGQHLVDAERQLSVLALQGRLDLE